MVFTIWEPGIKINLACGETCNLFQEAFHFNWALIKEQIYLSINHSSHIIKECVAWIRVVLSYKVVHEQSAAILCVTRVLLVCFRYWASTCLKFYSGKWRYYGSNMCRKEMRRERCVCCYYGRFTNHDEIMNSVDVVLKDPQNWIMVEVFWTYKVDSEPGLLTMHFFNTSDSKTGWMKDINFLSLN